jgi:hypothetical protein
MEKALGVTAITLTFQSISLFIRSSNSNPYGMVDTLEGRKEKEKIMIMPIN